MVGMAIGANRVARARRVAWTAAAVAFVTLGVIGTLLSIFPDLWVSMFTDDPAVRDASRRYLHISSPMLAFIGLNMALYFSSQGAAKIIGPVLSQTGRLIFIAVGGSLADLDQRHRHELLHPGRSLDGDAGARHRARGLADLVGAKARKTLSFSAPAALLGIAAMTNWSAGRPFSFCMMIIIFSEAPRTARQGRNE